MPPFIGLGDTADSQLSGEAEREETISTGWEHRLQQEAGGHINVLHYKLGNSGLGPFYTATI